ncbi:MAG: hypothetical protein D6719_05255 [Candidatus Dadabacteria bacterium]|nr:MAG: hypothetical protein D6719_05255 [Candidatus Dadabacteria bacterium]
MRYFTALILIILAVSAVQAQDNKACIFEIKILNNSDFTLSPGGYLLHKEGYSLFEIGQKATSAVKSLCEEGHTQDFLYYLRNDKDLPGTAFFFPGGVAARGEAVARFKTTPEFPLLSFLHKISFSDDTCVGINGLSLFDNSGKPVEVSVTLKAYDIGTRENIHKRPPKHPLLDALRPAYWKVKDTRPQQPIKLSTLFPDPEIASVTVTPLCR